MKYIVNPGKYNKLILLVIKLQYLSGKIIFIDGLCFSCILIFNKPKKFYCVYLIS